MSSTTGQLFYGKVLTPLGLIENGVIAVSGTTISYVGERKDLPSDYAEWLTVPTEENGLLIPGFVDVHVHGGDGHDFMDSDRETLDAITRFHSSQGTTTMLATTMTAPKADIDNVLREVNAYRSEDMPFAQLAGVHLEGPFISPQWPGAQNPEHIVLPNVSWLEAWEQQYPNLIRQVTLAPERDGALEVISWLRDKGITPALGHTDATYDQVIAAVEAGLSQAVHAFNAMTPLHHRKPGTAGAVLGDQRIAAELIADGIHVHPAVMSILARMKTESNLILITDAMSAAGLGDGEYTLGDQPVNVSGGIATLKNNDGALAGSTLTMIRGFRNLIADVGLTLEEASEAASLNPAISLGLDQYIGSLEAGKHADILLLDAELSLRNVWVQGRQIV
ncbi:N-acetylglucosamine-6-phosphate deacetylase [Paenibacillus macquariensis]|uniref:N-acetylglucosamine-6-phosphate deacetylase n=1 Tax=Paenibacillus macquariensis TaxID=948756 RepID=A0ABY1K4L1_9BACL|nr:N-acetylglucosamine-6-phosphate deacetylase [Paenibacillus macquariensis]MEC0089027.1 N-acetylglucosamine-6-phosphate deacetylase [Paenibacillus macquariensis]OAB31840.1 N-acetylglucosamine-6-phosphate deacetylase [Paenibacillus macquariensis subsp. macquariensis]SIR24739.1 N-acetylglucosamine-6-phosphate deacetylase [Paenibacillus macquariensis]